MYYTWSLDFSSIFNSNVIYYKYLYEGGMRL
nr:MAG TPA: hypothetical protein [Caudoviricetes sp.]